MTGVSLRPMYALPEVAHNLPVQPTPFIGRDKEVEAAAALLRRQDVRLLTLTGPGGTGKSRLAVELASTLLPDFPNGVVFVGLASISDPTLVPTTIAQALEITESGNRTVAEALKSELHDKHLLLLLDNFEQVLDASTYVTEILAAAPGVKVLVTSRERLRLRGEREFAVPPLDLPSDTEHLPSVEHLAQFEAIRLFVERATALRAEFSLEADNAPVVAEICARLDGLPLAIELAAARIKILPPHAMLGRLQNRLKLLTGGERDLPARQQTLRSTIEWSFDLLNDVERTLFRRVSVFSAGCSLDALETVCTQGGLGKPAIDPLDAVASLVDKNLMRRPPEDAASETEIQIEPRFTMLETIQEYAREKLEESGEGPALQQQHAAHFLGLAEQAEPELRGSHQVEWLNRLATEHDNLRTALRWYLDRGDVDQSLRLSAALMQFWRMRGHLSEGRNWLSEALASPGEAPAAPRARALMAAGTLASAQGDNVQARSLLEDSLKLFRRLGDRVNVMNALRSLGNEARFHGDYSTAYAYLGEGLVLARKLDDRWNVAALLGDLGIVIQTLGDPEAARAYYEESLQIRKELRDKRGIAMMLVNLGELARAEGDYNSAFPLYYEALGLVQELGDKLGMGYVQHNLGHVAYHQGDYDQAFDLFAASLRIFHEMSNKRDIVYCLTALAGLFGSQRQPGRAAMLFSAAQALANTISSHLDPADLVEYERNLATARSQLSRDAWDRAWARGQSMSLDQAVAYALEKASAEERGRDTDVLGKATGPLHSTGPLPGTGPLAPHTTTPLGDYPAGLTEREVEVLRLVATGLTDSEVADKLTISPRTVNRHLSSIYNKLNMSTRTAASRWAIENDLL